MRLWPILLRVLLSLALVLNGASGAAASVHMVSGAQGDMHSTAAAKAPTAVAAAESGCHDHAAQAAPGTDELGSKSTSLGKHGGMDCCESGACRCDCVHATLAGPLPWVQVAHAFGHVRYVGAVTLAHASPALPHLIRPPIG